jgi:hypothetical protein
MPKGHPRALRRALAMDRVRETAGGVQLLEHAKRRAAELGFHETDVLACIARPETTYGGHPQYGPGRRVYRRGSCACVVDETLGVVVTVLLNIGRQWTHGVDTRSSLAG